MTPWLIFIAISLIMSLAIVGGLLLHRGNEPSYSDEKRPAEDNRMFYLLLWLASLSIMAYIAFAFGKR